MTKRKGHDVEARAVGCRSKKEKLQYRIWRRNFFPFVFIPRPGRSICYTGHNRLATALSNVHNKSIVFVIRLNCSFVNSVFIYISRTRFHGEIHNVFFVRFRVYASNTITSQTTTKVTRFRTSTEEKKDELKRVRNVHTFVRSTRTQGCQVVCGPFVWNLRLFGVSVKRRVKYNPIRM